MVINEKKERINNELLQTKVGEKINGLRGKENKDWENYLQLDPKERKMKIEAEEAKENLWRWRGGKRIKGAEKMRKSFTIEKNEILRERLKKLNKIIEKSKMERIEEKKKKELFWKEKRTAIEIEKRDKKKRLEMKRRQEEKWGMIRWLTEFINLEPEFENELVGEKLLLEQSRETTPSTEETDKPGMAEQSREITSPPENLNPMEKFRQWIWERNGLRQKNWKEHTIPELWGKNKKSLSPDPTNGTVFENKNLYIEIKYGWSGKRKLRKFREKMEKIKNNFSTIGEDIEEQSSQIIPIIMTRNKEEKVQPLPEVLVAHPCQTTNCDKPPHVDQGVGGGGDSRLSPPLNITTRNLEEKVLHQSGVLVEQSYQILNCDLDKESGGTDLGTSQDNESRKSVYNWGAFLPEKTLESDTVPRINVKKFEISNSEELWYILEDSYGVLKMTECEDRKTEIITIVDRKFSQEKNIEEDLKSETVPQGRQSFCVDFEVKSKVKIVERQADILPVINTVEAQKLKPKPKLRGKSKDILPGNSLRKWLLGGTAPQENKPGLISHHARKHMRQADRKTQSEVRKYIDRKCEEGNQSGNVAKRLLGRTVPPLERGKISPELQEKKTAAEVSG